MSDDKPQFKEIDEVFTCDCGDQDCAHLVVTIMDDSMVVIEASEQGLLINIPWTWRLWRSLKIFWKAFWHKEYSVEYVLNRKQHKQFKAMFSTLKDERCLLCDPDYMEGMGRYWKHGH